MEDAMSLLLSLFLLMMIQLSNVQVLRDFPAFVKLPENSAPGRRVYVFQYNSCTDNKSPSASLVSSPETNFFNPPTIRDKGVNLYNIEIFLSSTVAFNRQSVNQYMLNITITCADIIMTTGKVFVEVTAPDEPLCEEKFISQAGETVQVPENVAPSSIIYTVVLRHPSETATYSIKEPSPGTFSINNKGQVLAPTTGFNYQSGKIKFTLGITVTDAERGGCNGTLIIEVLPLYHNTVKFMCASKTVTIYENSGPGVNVTQVQAEGNNTQMQILYDIINPTTAYYIEQETGVIRTTRNLDLERNPALVLSTFLIRAYNKFHHEDSATMTINIIVRDVNDITPKCSPAVLMREVPETTPIGTTLCSFSCTDLDISNNSLHFMIVPNALSRYSFRMQNSILQVNSTLNYDSEELASVNFQYTATIVVTDSGTPQLTTNIPVFVVVTPVNEYDPQCNPAIQSFSVDENAPVTSFIGQVNATDRDYKPNNVEFSIVGGNSPPLFYISPRSGDIHLLDTLDFEKRRSYQLKIQVVDLNNDIKPDPINQRTNTCHVTITVKDINDNPPVCNPPYYETTICSTLMMTTPIPVKIQCTDKDDNIRFFYSIVGGNINNRFNMRDSLIYHSTFSYNPYGVYDPLTFQLSIEVTDDPAPRLSTTVAIIIHVIPCTTTVPTTTEKKTTQKREPKIVTQTEQYWAPDPWFVAVLTITGFLLLAALAFLIWQLLSRTSFCLRSPKEASQPLLQNKSFTDIEAQKQKQVAEQQQQNMDKKDPIPVSPLSLQFDGRAQDPISGRDYLFNSRTGERRWI